jgi:hypothetical protein
VVDVSSANTDKAKRELLQVVSKMKAGDRAYLYAPANAEVCKHPGMIAGAIVNSRKLEIKNLGEALKQTVCLMSIEDMDAKKYVVLVSDANDKTFERYVKKGLSLDLRDRVGCWFVICVIGEMDRTYLDSLCSSHPHCDCIVMNSLEGLGRRLCESCMDEILPNYCPLDIDQLREDFYGKEHA